MKLASTAALITGGASGLGAATAAAFAAQGAQVYALDLSASIDKAPEVEGITYVPADVTDEDDVRAALESAGLPARVVTRLAPAWTTDWMSDSGKEKLRA